MRRGWLTSLLLLFFTLLINAPVAAVTMRIGLLHAAPPFAPQNGSPNILDDELNILFSKTPGPEIHRFASIAEGVNALNQRQIDVLIADRRPANYLQSSESLLAFPLAALTLKNGVSEALCFPELPVDLTPPCTLSSSASTDANVQRMIAGEAGRFIAPEFILRTWIAQAPATTLSIEPQNSLPPLHFQGWTLPDRTDALTELNAHIRSINPEDAHWLEDKWLLPAGSVFSARNPPTSENFPRQALQVLLPAASEPLVRLTTNGHLRGVWYDLLLNLFPASHFNLSFNINSPLVSLPRQSEKAQLKIVASQNSPTPEAIAFDTLSWGLVSPLNKALPGALHALQNRRIAVINHSPLVAVLRQRMPPKNLVLIKDFAQGFEIMRAGGADGLAGNAYALNYALQQHEETNLQLTPLGLPDTPLWFVPDISNPVAARRITAILSSVTKADVFNHREKPLAVLSARMSSHDRSPWLIMLAAVSFCAVLAALIAWSAAQRQRRQREQDTSELHNALSLWQTLMNNAPVPLFVCDPSGRLIRYNSAFARSPLLSEIPKEKALFASLRLGELADKFTLPQRLVLLNAAEPITGEARITGTDITVYWWLCRYTDKFGRPQGVVGGWVDISEKAALTAALNQALKQAERASDEKSNFLARMSHDIRTPLNSMLGLLELEKDRSDSLAVAWQSAELLRDLIGDILDISRIEAGELRLELAPHPLWQSLHASEKIFARSADTKGLCWRAVLDVPQQSVFYFDKSRLNQIIANLLGNAIKYTSKGEVGFYATLKDKKLHLRITDTGIGISPEAMPSIGQPWFQCDPTMPQSSGLGLAICYQLVELMGGTLTLTSTPGEGTEVTVLLPLQAATGLNAPAVAPQPTPLLRRRILIVDDFPANLTVLTLQLEKMGHEVLACESAAAALAQLANGPVDILITDCQMPEINGYQLVALLLVYDIAGIVPAPGILLGCTANALMEENDRARHAGMDGLLRKPISLSELQQALAQYTQPIDDTCDLNGLYQLADGRPEVIATMRKQMREALNQDFQRLKASTPSAEALSQLAHRLKASWSLFSMRETTRRCQAMEALPELLSWGLIEHALIPQLAERFSTLMDESLKRLDAALGKLSDKY